MLRQFGLLEEEVGLQPGWSGVRVQDPANPWRSSRRTGACAAPRTLTLKFTNPLKITSGSEVLFAPAAISTVDEKRCAPGASRTIPSSPCSRPTPGLVPQFWMVAVAVRV